MELKEGFFCIYVILTYKEWGKLPHPLPYFTGKTAMRVLLVVMTSPQEQASHPRSPSCLSRSKEETPVEKQLVWSPNPYCTYGGEMPRLL